MKSKKKFYLFEIDVVILNVLCTILMVLLFLGSYFINKSFVSSILSNINMPLFILLYLFYMVLHEIVHSISYVLYGGDFKRIVYGIQLESGVFYCLCKQNISRKNILNSLLFPLFYLGVIPYVLGLLFHNYYLFVLAIFNLAGCAGDIVMFFFIRKLSDIEFSEFDNPIRFAIYSSVDVSKVSHFGLKYIKCVDNIERNEITKIRVSKFSYVILFLLLVWCFIFGLLLK